MKRISQKRRLMVVKYQNQRDVDRLDTCLKMCCLPHVIFKEYEFVGGGALWKIYIDRGSLTWSRLWPRSIESMLPNSSSLTMAHIFKTGGSILP